MSINSVYRYATSWQCMTEEDAASVREFWRSEGANVAGHEADRRLQQIVLRALDSDGQLAAVSTAEPRVIQQLGQSMYYYRCFIGKAWRTQKLVRPLLLKSFDVLEHWARTHDDPYIGLFLELQNPDFNQSLQTAHWHFPGSTGYAFIGRNQHGFDQRVCYFRGARLKR